MLVLAATSACGQAPPSGSLTADADQPVCDAVTAARSIATRVQTAVTLAGTNYRTTSEALQEVRTLGTRVVEAARGFESDHPELAVQLVNLAAWADEAAAEIESLPDIPTHEQRQRIIDPNFDYLRATMGLRAALADAGVEGCQ